MMNARADANITEQKHGDVVNTNHRQHVLGTLIVLKSKMNQGMITLPNVVVKVNSLFNERRSINELYVCIFSNS